MGGMDATDLSTPAPGADIDLWLAYYGHAADLAPRLRALLTEDERAREARFHFADDRLCYLVTRALVRTVLSRYASLPPADWRFAENGHGRPHIAPESVARCPEAADLRFNVSHTSGLIVLGVTRGRELGVDVEHVGDRKGPLEVVDRYFAPAEIEALRQQPEAIRHDRFFEYWTFKESYIKARGLGLSLPLERFSFHYPHEAGVRLAIDPDLQDAPERWALWQYRPDGGYLLAVCAERGERPPATVALRRCLPLCADEPIAAVSTRRSDAF
jgi:4'-phosphopantetheinyl transferase